VDDVPYLRLAREQGLGETNLKAIDVVGDATTIEDWHRPGPPEASYSYRAGIGSGSTSIVFYRERVSYRPDISAEKCQHAEGCSSCVDVCPTDALSKGKVTPDLVSSECILCSACREVCEFGSLEFTPDEELMAAFEKQEGGR
jgi:ferredoxin